MPTMCVELRGETLRIWGPNLENWRIFYDCNPTERGTTNSAEPRGMSYGRGGEKRTNSDTTLALFRQYWLEKIPVDHKRVDASFLQPSSSATSLKGNSSVGTHSYPS